MLHIVDAASNPTFTPERSRVTVVLESDIVGHWSQAILELTEGGGARNEALAWAARNGMSQPCLNGNMSGAYAINSAGEQLADVKDPQGQPLPPKHPRMQIARYRIDVPLAARM